MNLTSNAFDRIGFQKVLSSSVQATVKTLVENTVLINTSRPETQSGWTRGTGFYIGTFNQSHLFVTNSHNMHANECEAAVISFLDKDLKKVSARCEKIIFNAFESDSSDITVFTIREAELKHFNGSGLPIDWNYTPKIFSLVAHSGFGSTQMSSSHSSEELVRKLKKMTMEVTFGETCFVTNKKEQLVRFSQLKINDAITTGCHGLGGDSGGPLVEIETGKVIGLVFASFSLNDLASSKTELIRLIESNSTKAFTSGTAAISFATMSELFKLKGLDPKLISTRSNGSSPQK